MTSPAPLLHNTYYHIYNRGINDENIFVETRNYEHFLNLCEKYLSPVTDLFAYCLLRNHFHLLIRTRSEGKILEPLKVSKTFRGSRPSSRHNSAQFSHFFNAYAKAINKAYGRTGSLFHHPFGRVPVTSDRQFWNVIAYIHQNPQKHGFVKDFRDWKYSSYGVILSGKKTCVNRNAVMEWFGSEKEYLGLHEHWVTDAESKWFAEEDYD